MSFTLQDIIKVLEAYPDQEKVLKIGFSYPHSYRGYYEDLAFEPEENVTVAQCLALAEDSLCTTFYGYKGGYFTMDAYTRCWFSRYGYSDGDAIGPTTLAYMLNLSLEDIYELIDKIR